MGKGKYWSLLAHIDTVEAVKAISSLKVLADSKAYPIDLTLDGGYITLANSEDKGQAVIPADIEGKAVKVRIDGSYLAQALKACGGMVDFRVTNAYSPMLFTADGYQLVVMPMMTNEASEQSKRDREAKATEAEAEAEAQAEPSGEAEAEVEGVTEGEAEPEADKPKRKRKAKEPVAVA